MTLYELLTFEPAFAEADRERLIHQVTQSEPTRPSRLNPRGAAGPGDDLPEGDRPRADSPLSDGRRAGGGPAAVPGGPADPARRASVGERAWRWCRRNPAVAGTVAVAALLIAVAIVATGLRSSTAWWPARRSGSGMRP